MRSLLSRTGERLAFALLPLLTITLTTFAGPDRGAGHLGFPNLDLPGVTRGTDAVGVLGVRLPEVARAYGTTATELRFRLLADPTLAVDSKGRLLFTDSAPSSINPGPIGATLIDNPSATGTAEVSTADALRLHSRPGAKRTLFLDFGGEVMVNNVWTDNYNGGTNIVAPAYDMDGDTTTFNETERSKIIEIWRRVAEDYAPFDVDVCTELTSEGLLTRSSISDDVYGVRVLFSPISRFVGNYGGVSYVGTFNDVGDYWKPSLVFTDTLGASNAKNLAEAASHEAGHALGLGHDGVSGGSAYYTGHGSGQTSWAPIMGVGYSRNVTQWSRGEYANANNREDDLQVMQSYGLGYRTDDHGNTLSAASYLPVGTALYAEGLIERNTDVDVFAFNAGAGALSLTVAPQGQGPNLDVWAELRDASGIVVATANPGTALAATFNLTVPAGTYFLSVKGDSAPTPPSTGYPTYGSLGNYSVTGTVVAPSVSMEPVAVAEASTVNGLAPLAVSFDGSRSFDPDGSLVSHEWNFGDGTRATGVAVSHSYAAAGVYSAVLTVTDNSGLSHSDLVEVTVVGSNVAPVAVLTASATTGTAPLSVSFSGAGSSHADGSIVSWSWNFGDGTGASGATVSKSYATAGTYVVVLTVTDNLGGTGSATTTIVVNPAVQRVMRVASIGMSTTRSSAGATAWARVRITDPAGNPVPGVSVTGRWTGLATSTRTAKTDSAGYVNLASKTVSGSGTFTFTVTKAVLTGWVYDASQNLQSSASVNIAAN